MQKLLIACVLVASLGACRDRNKESRSIDATFTNEKGLPLREVSADSILQINSAEFRGFNEEDIRIKNIKVKVDGIEAPILALNDGKISIKLPTLNKPVPKNLTITVSIQDAVRELLRKIMYQPTITATPFAGLGADGKPDGTFNWPAEMVMDSKENLYVIDQSETKHDRIIKVTPDGKTSIFLGEDGSLGRLVGIGISPLDTALYFSDATSLQVKKLRLSSPGSILVLAGSGKIGNENGVGLNATFRFGNQMVSNFGSNEVGQGMTVGKDGNVYVGESLGTAVDGRTSSVRKISPDGTVSTVSGSTMGDPKGMEEVVSPNGLTLNEKNEIVYTTGSSSFFQGLVKVSPTPLERIAGHITFEDLADGKREKAAFCYPKALQYSDGFYWVADAENCAIRRVDTEGNVITLAGGGHNSGASKCLCGKYQIAKEESTLFPSFFDKGPDAHIKNAKAIHIDLPGGIAVKNSGLMYFSDYGNFYKCIWKLTIK